MKEAARKIKEADAEILRAARQMKGKDGESAAEPADKAGPSGDADAEQELVPHLSWLWISLP